MTQEIFELEVSHLKKYYSPEGAQVLHAVDNVSFQIRRGETFGIVGEAGCGKTTCGKICLGLLEGTDGKVFFQGQNINEMSEKERVAFFEKAQMIFRDPYLSLNPNQKVYDIIRDEILRHERAKNEIPERERVLQILDEVGLNAECADRYVYDFPGIQRQKIEIARAVAMEPEFFLCDEPKYAMDISLQTWIVNLLLRLKKEKNLTILFVSRDLAAVRCISGRIGIMCRGKLVELAAAGELYEEPLHPYTRMLLSESRGVDPRAAQRKEQIFLEKGFSDGLHSSMRCCYCDRCRYAEKICWMREPILWEYGRGHFAACHFAARRKVIR